MKKNIFNTVFILISLLVLFSSCGNLTQNKSIDDSDSLVSLKIDSVSFDKTSRAVISVTEEDEVSYYKSLSYDLYAVNAENESKNLASEVSYEDLLNLSAAIKIGEWTFTLNAKDLAKNSVVLSASYTQEIDSENHSLHFALKLAEDVTGTVNFNVIYSSVNLAKDKDGNLIHPDFDVTLNDAKDNSVDESLYSCTKSEPELIEKGFYKKIYSFEVPVDKYNVYVSSGDEESSDYKYIGHDVVYVTPNFTYDVDYSTGRVLQSYKNQWSREEYNYVVTLNFNDVVENFNKKFNVGDKISVAFAGMAEQDFEGELEFSISGNNDDYSAWVKLGSVSNFVSFKAGQYFNETFDLVITDDDYNNSTWYGVNFGYEKDSLDSLLKYSNVEIAIDFDSDFEVVKYTYHHGGLTHIERAISGKPYRLKKYPWMTDSWLIFNCWRDEDGNEISEISAKDNVTDRDFYADLSLKFYKNVFNNEGGYNYTSGGLAFKDTESVVMPENNKIYEVTLTGIPDKDVNNLVINGQLATYDWDSSAPVWNEKIELKKEVNLVKDEKATLVFDFLIPDDFEQIDLNYFFISFYYYDYYNTAKDDFDDELIFQNYTVTAAVKEFENILDAPGIHLDVIEEGFEITLTKPDDVESWEFVTIVDNTTNNSFSLDHWVVMDLDDGESVSFVYPFTNAGRIYSFSLQTDYWPYPTVYAKATGGKGEFDFTEIYKLTPEIIYEDGNEYLSIPQISENTADVLKNCDNVEFIWQVISGKTDWSDTKWVQSFTVPLTSKIYTELLANKKLNLFDEDIETFILLMMNEELSKRDIHFAEIAYCFDTPETHNIGKFQCNNIYTPETVYHSPSCLDEVYTLKFDTDGGSEIGDVEYKFGEYINFDDFVPVKKGYTFLGWAVNEEIIWGISKGNITVKAVWERLETPTYQVIFEPNGGTLGETSPSYMYTYGESFDLPIPTKDGYNFVFWQTEYGLVVFTSDDIPLAESYETVKLTAIWDPKICIVAFFDGVSIIEKRVEYNTKIEPFEDPVKQNYEFLGWFDNNGSKFSFDQTIMDDLTLEAKWQAPNAGFTISFSPIANSTPGTLSINTLTEENSIILMPVSENPDVSFYAWSVDGGKILKQDFYSVSEYGSHIITCFACDFDGNIIEILNTNIYR